MLEEHTMNAKALIHISTKQMQMTLTFWILESLALHHRLYHSAKEMYHLIVHSMFYVELMKAKADISSITLINHLKI